MQTTNLQNLKIENQCNKIFGYIYLTINKINNKKYIGQRRAFNCSPKDDNYLGSGILLNKAIKLYGKENFLKEILEYCESQEELNKCEQKWISFYDAVKSDNFYNIAVGGLAGDTWLGRSIEEKEKFKEKIKKSNKKRIRNPENISGNKNPAYGKKWCNDGKINYLLPIKDIIDKKLMLGMIRKPEHNKKISEAHKGKKHNYSLTQNKICYNNGIKNKFINQNEVLEYEEKGWKKGMINTRWEKQ